MERHLEAAVARISQLKGQDLAPALQGLLRQAKTALRPPSKSDRLKGAATPAPQRRALASAIVLLLERAGRILDPDGPQYQAVRAQLLAAFQQHAFLWERLIRADLAEVLGAPAAAGLFTEVLLLLGGSSQARAFGLIRQQLPQCLAEPPSAVPRAGLQAVLAHVFARLTQCFPVVSYALPEHQAGPSGSGPSQQQLDGGASRVQVVLSEQLPALLHLSLLLACWEDVQPPDAGAAAAVGGATRASQGSSAAGSNAGPGGAGGAASSAGGAAEAGPPAKQAAADGASRVDGSSNGLAAGAIKEAMLRYAALLLQRLGQPDALQETLGLTLASAPAAAPASARGAAAGRLGEAELGRVQVAQQAMEVLLDAMLTLPAVAAATVGQRRTSVTSNQEPAAAAGPATVRQLAQQAEGSGRQEAAAGEAGNAVAALLALHWELAKLRVACSAEPEGKGGKAQPAHLSHGACLQLLRLATTKQHLAGGAVQRLLASMPRGTGGANRVAALPPVQLLLPPAVMAHLLDLIARALEGGPSQNARAGAPPGAAAASAPDAGLLAEMAERVLEIQQACFQGLVQPWVVLHGPLHREAISAASRLHSLLTQPPAATAEAIQAAAAAAAAVAACDMGAEGALDEAGARRRSTARKRSAVCLAEAALAGLRPPAPKRPKAGAGGGTQTGAAPVSSGAPSGSAACGAGSEAAAQGEPANPVAELLQLFELQLGPSGTPGPQEAAGREEAATLPLPPPEQQQQQQLPPPSARKRVTPQQVPQLVQQAAQVSGGAQQAQQGGGAATKKRVTPVAVTHAPTQAGAAPSSGVAAVAGPSTSGGGAAAAAAAAQAGPGQQQAGGRVHLTATAELDDAGKEALWEAYIADKEFLVEMLGDTNYQDWYDEEAHPLPAHHAATLKGVDAMLDEALGSPLGDDSMDDSSDADADNPLPPGPRTLLAASVQLPWQAALAGCLLLLQRCLGRALAGVEGGASGAAAAAGAWAGAATPTATQPPATGPEAAAQLLGRVLGERELAEAGLAAAMAVERHCGAGTAVAVKRGACSHPAGGALLHFITQLLEVAQHRAGSRTAPVLLSAYASLLGRLLPLAQQEEQRVAEESAGSKKLGRPPLQLLPQVALRLLETQRLRSAALMPDSVACLLQLACPQHQPQEALAQHAALLWGLLQPAGRRSQHAQAAPAWLELCPCGPPHQLLPLRRGAPPEAQAAAAEELLGLLGKNVEQWEAGGGLEAAGQGLAAPPAALAPSPAAAAAAAGGGPARTQQRGRGKGRSRKAAAAGEPLPDAAAAGPAEVAAGPAGPSARAVQQGGGDAGGWLAPEALLPAMDACCSAVHWLAQQEGDEDGAGAAGAAASGLLDSTLALRRLLMLCHRLVAICIGVLQQLATYMDALPGDDYPPWLSQAATLWAVSLEMGASLEDLDAIAWPQALRPARQALRAALEELAGVQRSCAELLRGLPEAHAAYSTIVEAMDGEPSLSAFRPGAAEGAAAGALSAGAGAAAGGAHGKGRAGSKPGGKAQAVAQRQQKLTAQRGQRRRRRRRLQDIRNPFLRAMIQEGGCYAEDLEGEDLSDLEDFIVFNPHRDYDQLLAQHFPMPRDDDEDDSEEEGPGGEEAGEGEVEEGAVGAVEAAGGPLEAAPAAAGVPSEEAARGRGRPRKQKPADSLAGEEPPGPMRGRGRPKKQQAEQQAGEPAVTRPGGLSGVWEQVKRLIPGLQQGAAAGRQDEQQPAAGSGHGRSQGQAEEGQPAQLPQRPPSSGRSGRSGRQRSSGAGWEAVEAEAAPGRQLRERRPRVGSR